jgi:D-serine deaminase-like pyridoxal phosphate-dependent protein
LVVNAEKMEINLREMAEFAERANVRLRPHIKTHKCPELALKQISYGAVGICVQKVSEAEVMVKNGVKNVLISNEIIGIEKVRRLVNLSKEAEMSVCVDSMEGIRQLSQVATESDAKINCLIDIDCGYHRCGVSPTQAAKLAQQITQMKCLELKGITGYEGHVGSHPRKQWPKLVKLAMAVVMKAKKKIEENSISVEQVVVGGTPSAKISGLYPGVTEITPGEYIFYCYRNVKSGLVQVDRCALSVLSTAMSKPTANRIVIDAGLKTFAFDGNGEYPYLMNENLRKAHFVSLSEEHGTLRLPSESNVKIGDILEFVPYNIGTCVNLHDTLYLTTNGRVEKTIPILARGMTV